MKLPTLLLLVLLVVIALAALEGLIARPAGTPAPNLTAGHPGPQVHAGPSLGTAALNAGFGVDARHLPGAEAATRQGTSGRHSVVRDGVELALRKQVDGACLTEPRVRIFDPQLSEPVLLTSGELISLAREPERTVRLEPDGEGWVLERDELSVGPGSQGPIEIPVRPRHRILVNLTLAGTYDWVQSARLQAHWEESGSGRRAGSRIVELSSESGGYILEAPAVDRGRVRVEAVADGTRPERSAWLPVDSSTEWVEFDLALHRLEDSTAEVLVTVTDQEQARIQGAWVSVFEELDSNPLVGVRVTERGLEPLREGKVDPDLLDAAPTAATIEGGLAGFVLKAPASYRIATWVQGRGDSLGEVIHFEPGDELEVTAVIGATSTLRGRVLASLDDFPAGTVKEFGDVRLYDPGQNKSYLAELKRDGTFRFDGVAPGDYQLEVNGSVDGFHGNETVIPLMSREVTIAIGQDQWVELALGESASGQRVSGLIDFGVKMEQWTFLVGLVRLGDGPDSGAGSRANLHSKRLIRANALGEFEFTGVDPGRYRVVSLGVRADRQATAYLHQELVLDAAREESGPLLLAPLGGPLYLQLADREAHPQEISVHVESEDALSSFLIDEADALIVQPAFPSVFFGLPEGELTLRSGGEDLDLVVDRASVVLVP